MKQTDGTGKGKTYSYKTRRERVRLRIIAGMESICEQKGKKATERAQYYDGYDFQKTDPQGSYTGVPTDNVGTVPVQDADDL